MQLIGDDSGFLVHFPKPALNTHSQSWRGRYSFRPNRFQLAQHNQGTPPVFTETVAYGGNQLPSWPTGSNRLPRINCRGPFQSMDQVHDFAPVANDEARFKCWSSHPKNPGVPGLPFEGEPHFNLAAFMAQPRLLLSFKEGQIELNAPKKGHVFPGPSSRPWPTWPMPLQVFVFFIHEALECSGPFETFPGWVWILHESWKAPDLLLFRMFFISSCELSFLAKTGSA